MAGPPSPSPPSPARSPPPSPPSSPSTPDSASLFKNSASLYWIWWRERGVGWMEGGFENFCDFPKDFSPLSLSSRLLAERKRGNNCTYLKLPRGRRRSLSTSALDLRLCQWKSRVRLSVSEFKEGEEKGANSLKPIFTQTFPVCLSVLDQQCMCMRFRLLPSGFRMGMFHVNSRRRRSSRSQSSVSDEDFAIPASSAEREIYAHSAPCLSV